METNKQQQKNVWRNLRVKYLIPSLTCGFQILLPLSHELEIREREQDQPRKPPPCLLVKGKRLGWREGLSGSGICR